MSVKIEEWELEEQARIKADNNVFKKVKALLSDQEIEIIKEGFQDCSYVYNFQIVDYAEGDDQEENWENGTSFCCQNGNGDHGYAGEFFIPLPGGKYFKYEYTS